MKCSDIGERGLVRLITEILGGIDHDDCAVIDLEDRFLVATTDMLHRETDFPKQASPWQIGWMSAAVNLSDIAAMGAEPLGLLMATGIPPETEVDSVEGLFRGMHDCARSAGTRILGGDMDSHKELTIAGTALGTVRRELIIRRRGSRPGDLLCTTGSFGGAGAGLRILLSGGDPSDPLSRKLLEPEPRLAEGQALARSRSVTSMMDNSDGLAISLYDLAEASDTGFVVRAEALPVARGAEEIFGHDEALEMALYSGGDFELIFTVRPEMIDAAYSACRLGVIGTVVDQGVWIERDGKMMPLAKKGFLHMSV